MPLKSRVHSIRILWRRVLGKKAARRRQAFIATLERLQDTLGDLNDISVHEGLAEGPTAERAFAAGRLSGREEARIASVLKKAEGAYARFTKARAFWR